MGANSAAPRLMVAVPSNSTSARRSAAICVIWLASSGSPNVNPALTTPASTYLRKKPWQGLSFCMRAVR